MSLAQEMADNLLRELRLAILQLLDGQSDGSANDAVLVEAVNALDFVCSREKLREQLFWLASQGVLTTLDLRLKSGFVIATLTEKGRDCVLGRSMVAGIARPQSGG